MNTNRIITNLNEILNSSREKRVEIIKDFQNRFWDDNSITNHAIENILSELTYDLNFYEPDVKLRKESPSYYGDDLLEEIIKGYIQKIKKHLDS